MASEATFDYASKFYDLMDKGAFNEDVTNGRKARVFRGSVTSLFKQLGASQAYYSKVRKALIESGCMTILQQGARGLPTVIVLHGKPERETFVQSRESDLTKRLDGAILSQRVDNLERRLGGLDPQETALNFEKRLRELESRMNKVEQSPPTPARKVP
jgi:hypothetical protein